MDQFYITRSLPIFRVWELPESQNILAIQNESKTYFQKRKEQIIEKENKSLMEEILMSKVPAKPHGRQGEYLQMKKARAVTPESEHMLNYEAEACCRVVASDDN